MIDYFTKEELLHCQYAIISASLGSQRYIESVVGLNILYPNYETIENFIETGDEEAAKKEYLEYLFPSKKCKDSDKYWLYDLLKRTFVDPLKLHHDVIIIYDDATKMYIDVLCDALKEKFKLEFLNLDTLFEKGRVGSIYLDMKAIEANMEVAKKYIDKNKHKSFEQTEAGRSQLLNEMTVQEKIKKLKKLGIKVDKHDINEKRLNKLLYDAWVLSD